MDFNAIGRWLEQLYPGYYVTIGHAPLGIVIKVMNYNSHLTCQRVVPIYMMPDEFQRREEIHYQTQIAVGEIERLYMNEWWRKELEGRTCRSSSAPKYTPAELAEWEAYDKEEV